MRLLATALLLLSATTFGCAYRNAVARGHQLAAAGDYRGALASYQRAVALDPDDEEARRYVDQLVPYALRQAEEKYSSAMDAGRYEEALEHAGYVATLDRARGDALTGLVRDGMMLRVLALERRREMEPAYALAIRTRALFPHARGLPEAFDRLREHYLDESARYAELKRFGEALASLEVIARHEPVYARQLAPERQRILLAWADDVAAQAAAHQRDDRIGAAAALYARAYELAGRETDAEAMRSLTRELRRDGSFIVDIDSSATADVPLAARARSERFAILARDAAAGIPSLKLFDDADEGVTLLARVEASRAICDQESTVRTGHHEYVASMREVPNPEHARMKQELADHEELLARLSGQVSASATHVDGLRDRTRRCQQALSPLERSLASAERKQRGHESEVTSLTRRIEQLEKRLARTSDQAARDAIERDLRNARRDLSRAEETLRSAIAEASAARGSRDAQAQNCAELDASLAEAERALSQVRSELASVKSRVRSASADLRRIPATVTEPVMAVFAYPIREVTRTCRATARAHLEPAWTSDELLELREESRTADDENDAHPHYGVAADPLVFPLDDAALVSQVDQALAGALAQALRTRIQRYYRSMAERAIASEAEDPDAAADMMVALLLAARPYLDDATRAHFADHLKTRFGLQDPSTLLK